jgi:RNA polymerase sigma-70 factor (ECF subfamily)
VYRIGINLALNRKRRWRTAPRILPLNRGDRAEPPPSDPDLSDPSRPLERAELEHRVQRALQRLPEEFRTVVVMKDFDDLRYEQIAAILDIPIGTVRSRLHRARGELRELLRDRDEPSPTPVVLGLRTADA